MGEPLYKHRHRKPSGCEAAPDCPQDNMFMTNINGTCKCLLFQYGDSSACSQRSKDKNMGCGGKFVPIPGDEMYDPSNPGKEVNGKELRITFIDLPLGNKTIPACGCYKDEIDKARARERQNKRRDVKKKEAAEPAAWELGGDL